MGLAALKDVHPDAMIIYSDVDEIVSWQHLLVLKTADDFQRVCQRVCAFRYAVVQLQLSLEYRKRCLQQRQDLPSLVSRRLPWRQLIFRFQQPTLEFTGFGLALLVLLFRGRHPFKIALVRAHGSESGPFQ